MKKRLLGIFLAICMICTLVPTAVLAEGEDDYDIWSFWGYDTAEYVYDITYINLKVDPEEMKEKIVNTFGEPEQKTAFIYDREGDIYFAAVWDKGWLDEPISGTLRGLKESFDGELCGLCIFGEEDEPHTVWSNAYYFRLGLDMAKLDYSYAEFEGDEALLDIAKELLVDLKNGDAVVYYDGDGEGEYRYVLYNGSGFSAPLEGTLDDIRAAADTAYCFDCEYEDYPVYVLSDAILEISDDSFYAAIYGLDPADTDNYATFEALLNDVRYGEPDDGDALIYGSDDGLYYYCVFDDGSYTFASGSLEELRANDKLYFLLIADAAELIPPEYSSWLIYDGEPKEAFIEQEGYESVEIVYTDLDTGKTLEGAPVVPGRYSATASLGSKTAVVRFEIEKMWNSLWYMGEGDDGLPIFEAEYNNDKIIVSYAPSGSEEFSTEPPTKEGRYTVRAEVPEDECYDGDSMEISFYYEGNGGGDDVDDGEGESALLQKLVGLLQRVFGELSFDREPFTIRYALKLGIFEPISVLRVTIHFGSSK